MATKLDYNPSTGNLIPITVQTSINNTFASLPITLTNKVINGNNNTISNISSAQLNPALVNQINSNTSNLANHIGATQAHGVSGDIVGTTDTQILSNKVLQDSTLAETALHADKISTFGNNAPVITQGHNLSLGGGGTVDFFGNSISGSIHMVADGTAISDTVMINFEWSPGWNSTKSYSIVITPTTREAARVLPSCFIEKFDTNWNLWNTNTPPTVGEQCSFDYLITAHQ